MSSQYHSAIHLFSTAVPRSSLEMQGKASYNQLPPGFRFHPTDEELIVHYLRNQATSRPCPASIIPEVDIYKFDPWQLPEKAEFGENEWYFFTPRDRKYPNGVRPNRATVSGYWKATGTDKAIHGGSKYVGVKKALVFYKGRPPKGAKTDWIMHEYRLNDPRKQARQNGSMRLDDWVLCRIYKKRHTVRQLEEKTENTEEQQINVEVSTEVGNAEQISTGPVKEPMKDIMEDEPVLQPPVSSSSPHRLHPISESAGDTAETTKLNGAMKMETKMNTHSNLSLENAESSCKTEEQQINVEVSTEVGNAEQISTGPVKEPMKDIMEDEPVLQPPVSSSSPHRLHPISEKTVEWTLQITSMLLEATSAIFEQLGYPLPSMVMAFVALLLFILDLINKARGKRISFDWRSLLPCFYRHDPNREYFGFIGALGVVEYFGFAGAVWQCSHTTVGYHYSRLGFKIDEIVQAWNEMYDAKRWEIGVPSFRLEPLFRRRVPKLHDMLEQV